MSSAAASADDLRPTMPSGLWHGGAHLRRAVLRPLTGGDEEVLAEAADELPARRAGLLLGRCLLALEAEGGDGPEAGEGLRDSGGLGLQTARRLTVGDREALLLHLRRITFGDTMDAVLDCPRPECGERMDLALSAAALLLPPYAAPRPVHEAVLGAADGGPRGGARVRFRLPTGADQEAAAEALLAAGAEAAVAALARRCLLPVDGEATGAGGGGEPAAERLAALSAAIAAADPQAELLLDLTCPECGERFSSRFDTAGYLLAELAAERGVLYPQVHALAFHYHWSEAEILSLTPRKRRLYLGLLAAGADDGSAVAERAARRPGAAA